MMWMLLLSGGVFFTSANLLLRFCLGRIFSTRLSLADKFLITEKCVCSLQAVMATCAGGIIVQQCRNNIMTDTFWLTKAYAWFGLPYFIYDTWAIYNTHYYLNEPYMSSAAWKSKTVHFFKGNTAMIFHHVMLPLIFFPTILFLREDKGDYFVGLFYMVEAAIPFISLRFILAQLQFKDSAVYIISGLLMILVFFLARVCVFPFLYWKYSVFSGIPFLQVPFTLPIKCNIGCLILLVLQVYFLFLMIRGAFKVFYKMYQNKKIKLKKL